MAGLLEPAIDEDSRLARPASDLLRLTTAGSVDDGKSTLIGRLLYDSKAIATDQLAAIERASRRRAAEGLDLSLLTDGLRAEREQGITIDVAYRYFATPLRTFIIADTPGHRQYTQNMVTGASTADLAVVLVDARAGIVEQTRRHLAIAALLRVPEVVVVVNKMDLVAWDQATFTAIRDHAGAIGVRLGMPKLGAIPVSALTGDNVVERSVAMPWYLGPSLLQHLETVEITRRLDTVRCRFAVQWVIRGEPTRDPDYRAYAGRVDGGVFRPGDEIVALPSGTLTRIASIDTFDGPIDAAFPPLSVAIRLVDDIDLGRGGLIAGVGDAPPALTHLEATVCWFGREPLAIGGRYLLRHTTRQVRAIVKDVVHRLEVDNLERDSGASSLGHNDIGRVVLGLGEPIFADPYRLNRVTGSAVLIDELSNVTVGAVVMDQGPEP